VVLRKVKVDFWKSDGHLSEIYQSTGFKYAFLSSKVDGYKQCHPWVKCRDFLNDAVRNQITKRNDNIYGFFYTPGTNPPIDLKAMRMLVKCDPDIKKQEENASKNILQMMLSALAIIHCVERYGEVKPISRLYTATENSDVYLFFGAADWVMSPFMVSLYSFLIRLGAKKIVFANREDLDTALKKLSEQPVQHGDNDISYLKVVYPYIHNIVRERKKLGYLKEDGSNLFEKEHINNFHSYTGIVSLCDTKHPNIPDLKALSEHIRKKEN
jgi:hypothetical protein